MKKESDQYGKVETLHRLRHILRGAFSGSPTPLKSIPKRDGESRRIGKQQPASVLATPHKLLKSVPRTRSPGKTK